MMEPLNSVKPTAETTGFDDSPQDRELTDRGSTDRGSIPRGNGYRKPSIFKPFQPISPTWYLALALCGFVGFLGIWSLVTYTGSIDKLFLPTPTDILQNGIRMFAEFNFLNDIFATVWRVLLGFALAAVVAVPLGILMGVYRPIEAILEPLVSFARYMPASAFIPLLILWVGIGDAEKVSVIFLGSLFSLILMVAVHVHHVRRELTEAAYTLGAKDGFVVRHVVIPAAFPEIYDTLRLVLGWAWTYVIVAELVAAKSGIGYVILQSQRMLQTADIIFGIVVIGFIGLLSDLLMKGLGFALFRWRE
nr:ABC transporter permease [Kyrpidia tusciae]